jgi:dihydroorotase
MDIESDDGRFKMNPPLRSAEDRDALIRGVLDGTVDMIATDHAPHSAEEKSRGLRDSMMGVVGIETAFPILYTKLVRTGIVPLETVVRLLTDSPRKRFKTEQDRGFTVFDLGEEYEINPDEFLSMGKSTPFAGVKVFGRCLLTVLDGQTVYANEKLMK